jgi:hypothetical protein
LVFDQHGRIGDVIDLKFGVGVTVEPDSLQLQLYALLAAQMYGCDPRMGVTLHVIQPRRQHRSGPHRLHGITPSGLASLLTKLKKAVVAIDAQIAPRVAGKWCRFCAARETCPEAQAWPGWKPTLAEQMRELSHVLSD